MVDHVIILSEDCLGSDTLVAARTPTHDALMRQGAYSLRAKTMRRASTLPSHAAMLSGFDESAHGLTWNSWRPERGFIQVPTVFTAALAAGKGAAAFVGKRKLEHLTQPGSSTVFRRPGTFCRRVAKEAADYFLAHRPQVQFVHFTEPDWGGHRSGWMSEEQLTAIGYADRCLATLVKAIQNSGAFERTLLIVSADHGGHGHSHSGHHAADRKIPWIAWGAKVKPGYRIQGPVASVDTAATVLWALGHQEPAGYKGRPVTEAFLD
jgi:arylsulfatase A-like enzyme